MEDQQANQVQHQDTLKAAEMQRMEQNAPAWTLRVQQARKALRAGDDRLAYLLKSVPMRKR